MYESKQPHMRERTNFVKRNPDGENRTGIPPAMRNRYEEASGLSFADVRIHYNSPKPEQLKALAYTQGNHVYLAPGQEKHLGHELGHVVQQKRGLVRPTEWVNGLPVNTERRLEQQAESGAILAHSGDGETGRYHSGDVVGNPGLVRYPVSENAGNIIQGLFLKYTSEGGETFLTEAEDEKHSCYNTANLTASQILLHMAEIPDTGLLRKLSVEMEDKLYQITDSRGAEEVLKCFPCDEDTAGRVVNALSADCLNWLLTALKNREVAVESRKNVWKYVRERLKQQDVLYGKPYQELFDKIEALRKKMDFVRGMKEGTVYEQNRKKQLMELLKWELNGYYAILMKFPDDVILHDSQNGLGRRISSVAGSETQLASSSSTASSSVSPSPASSSSASPSSVGEAWEKDKYAVTYAAQESQRVPLPKRNELSAGITNDEPVRRGSGEENITALARQILLKVEQAKTRDRLVIYRGMSAVEALSILQFFNSSKAYEVEAAIKGSGTGSTFNIHNEDNFAGLGKHYGEYAQAEQYTEIQDNSESIPNYANVLLAFVLKPGARELLFSKSLLALPGTDLRQRRGSAPRQQHGSDLRQQHEGFAVASENEGTAPGYIGIKAERIGVMSTFSLGVGNRDSKMLLQLLIDRVEVERILYKESSGGGKSINLSAAAGGQ